MNTFSFLANPPAMFVAWYYAHLCIKQKNHLTTWLYRTLKIIPYRYFLRLAKNLQHLCKYLHMIVTSKKREECLKPSCCIHHIYCPKDACLTANCKGRIPSWVTYLLVTAGSNRYDNQYRLIVIYVSVQPIICSSYWYRFQYWLICFSDIGFNIGIGQ